MKKKFLKVIKILIISFTICLSLMMFFLVVITHNMDYKMPEIVNIELYDNQNQKYLSYSNGKKQSYVKINDISQSLIDAFISIEDKKFYSHHGLNFKRIAAAIISNLKNGKITEGASTITQQYVKNIYLSSEKTWKRKINEMLISLYIEKNYSKDEILEGYLNSIYFDHGIYGVEDASIFYFNKKAKDLTLLEAVTIASIPKGPAIYSPIKNPENNLKRRNLILEEMYLDQKISFNDYQKNLSQQIICLGNNPVNDVNNSPYFQDIVINDLKTIPQIRDYLSKGLKIYTTLDSTLYTKISESIKKRSPNDLIQTAVYAIEPKTGYVLSVIGGKDYEQSSYNRAVSSFRQPGSTIKPFLYLTALENGFTLSNTFISEKTTFYYNNQVYSPSNFQNIYAEQEISMVYALATSDNMYAVKTHLFLGPDKLVSTLKRFGFSGEIPAIPSLSLGVKEISLKELTEAYSTLANLGKQLKTTTIKKVTTLDDELIYEFKKNQKSIASKEDTFILTEAMTSIFDNNMTYNIRPTGVAIKSLLKGKYSGKSGSTDTDNWMMGFSPDIVVGVWTGYDDNRLITNNQEAKFGKYIWADTIESYYEINNLSHSWYEVPDSVVKYELNPVSGFYGSFDDYVKDLYFRKDNIPWFISKKESKNIFDSF